MQLNHIKLWFMETMETSVMSMMNQLRQVGTSSLRLVGVAPKRRDGLTGVGFIHLRFEWE